MRFSYHRIAIITHDLFMVSVAWFLAFLSRYNFSFAEAEWNILIATLPVVLVVQGIALWWTRLYRGLWRFASIPDLWNIMRAVIVGVTAVGLVLFFFIRLEGIPRSIFALYPIYLVLLLGGPRLAYRISKDYGVVAGAAVRPARQRMLLLGAGRAGEMLARDMTRDRQYFPVAFLDDNPQLLGAKVHGVPVLGKMDQISAIVDRLEIEVVIIAMPSAASVQMRNVVEECEKLAIPFRILPKLNDVVSGGASTLSALREVAIEDLLGREPVSLDWQGIKRGLASKVVMITGGGGSIGSELCRQIAKLQPQSLVLFERSEFNLYRIELELQAEFPLLNLHCCLGDVCDSVVVENVMDRHHPDIVFHAAAYKHVPMLEENIRAAIQNNILGSQTVALAADKHNCSTFVMISTDKAVNPTNVMGASKRAAEIFCQSLNNRSRTKFITVRFGNVLGSAGSVVPLFRQQIKNGGPVTVTHPEITRYFMIIPEACQLIMQAGVMGQGGEIFVLDMGSPVPVKYLAEQMIRLSGKVPDEEIKIVFTGLRPGEKLYEELFYKHEVLSDTGHSKIMLANSNELDWDVIKSAISIFTLACSDNNVERMIAQLKTLVPGEYCITESDKRANDSKVVELKRA
ncbi:UDP-N-acetylglucosamine 4,6-dehydratase [hydrothermal vent metagenome]|uniref:UDP-N-acetylglucosamine 4,6-dehydratase n=1 Tax=hydrothermal vent metagenome TaxID=652676 RepID=A0A3B0ZDN3_9ZZZZ